MEARSLLLFETATGAFVEAVLHPRLSAAQVVAAEAAWKPARDALGDEIEHGHWDWSLKAPLLEKPGARFLGVEHGGVMQGMMAVWETGHAAKLPGTNRAPLVYVDYLEAAPWNLPLRDRVQWYRGVGRQLIEQAVLLSIARGYDGRLGLVSLPRAESFYERVCGMTPVGQDPRYNGLMCYELTAAHAHRLLGR